MVAFILMKTMYLQGESDRSAKDKSFQLTVLLVPDLVHCPTPTLPQISRLTS
jgi:hypothetical protein